MSDTNNRPLPDGSLRGDTKSMPDRGTSTGMGDNAQTEGMSLDLDATNSMGSIRSATQSDAPGESPSDDPTFGARGSDPDDTRGYA